MKKLLTLLLVLALQAGFTSLSTAQQRSEEKGRPESPTKSTLKGVNIQGNTATLQRGFAFRRTGKDAAGRDRAQVLDPTGRFAITIVCYCNKLHPNLCTFSIKGTTARCSGPCTGECILEQVN